MTILALAPLPQAICSRVVAPDKAPQKVEKAQAPFPGRSIVRQEATRLAAPAPVTPKDPVFTQCVLAVQSQALALSTPVPA